MTNEAGILVTPAYASINAVADICEPWIELWGGDEWGESMLNLQGACHTNYGFSDEDCALFASKLIENLVTQREWMLYEGWAYGFMEPDALESARKRCRELRDYWLQGGNLKDERSAADAKATIDTMPTWLFETPEEEKHLHDE